MRFPLKSLLVPGLLLAAPSLLSAHCDALDGPVVKAARRALETGSPDGVLAWVRPADESAVRQAFARTLAVRKLGPEAKELADLYFFETVVRIHRAGEGAPYTGLKPAGQDIGPAIPAADRSRSRHPMLTPAGAPRIHGGFQPDSAPPVWVRGLRAAIKSNRRSRIDPLFARRMSRWIVLGCNGCI